MSKMSNCDRKSKLAEIRTGLLNPREGPGINKLLDNQDSIKIVAKQKPKIMILIQK